jgi:hypothetical protein
MAPVTKKHQQLILLEPEQAASLDGLAKLSRIPKQVLLREAVSDLLSKYDLGRTPEDAQLIETLKAARSIASRYASRTNERIWQQKIEGLLEGITSALETLHAE